MKKLVWCIVGLAMLMACAYGNESLHSPPESMEEVPISETERMEPVKESSPAEEVRKSEIEEEQSVPATEAPQASRAEQPAVAEQEPPESKPETPPPATGKQSSTVLCDITLHFSELPYASVNFEIKSTTDQTVRYGQWAGLDQLLNGEWTPLQFTGEIPVYTTLDNSVAPGETGKIGSPIPFYWREAETGSRYRIIFGWRIGDGDDRITRKWDFTFDEKMKEAAWSSTSQYTGVYVITDDDSIDCKFDLINDGGPYAKTNLSIRNNGDQAVSLTPKLTLMQRGKGGSVDSWAQLEFHEGDAPNAADCVARALAPGEMIEMTLPIPLYWDQAKSDDSYKALLQLNRTGTQNGDAQSGSMTVQWLFPYGLVQIKNIG